MRFHFSFSFNFLRGCRQWALALAAMTAAAYGQPTELETVEVVGSAPSRVDFPDSVQAFGGGNRNIDAVPRAVTLLPAALLDDFEVHSLDETLLMMPGTQGTAQFGHLTTPTVRGDAAELYLNGQRRSNNLFGYRPSMNAVDSMELVRGPAGAVSGPGFHSGGYVNFLSKLPRLDGHSHVIKAVSEGWALDGSSWDALRWQMDLSRVLRAGHSAVRVSIETARDRTFMSSSAARDDTDSIYASFRYRPDERWELIVSAEWMRQRAPQLLGVNRPSPELMRDGLYFRGESGFADFGDGAVFVISPPLAGPEQVALPVGAGLISDGDRSDAKVGWVQVVVQRNGETFRFANRTLVEGVDRERVHEFEYFEFVDQWTWENRSEWTVDLMGAKYEGSLTGGFALRWEYRRSFVNFFNEVPSAFDLSQGSGVYSIRDQFPSLVVPGIVGPAGLEFFGLPFSPETTRSELWNPGLFMEGSLKVDGGWEFVGGVRGDAYDARARDPITPQGKSDRYRTGSWSGFGSAMFSFSRADQIYLTVSDTNAVEGSIAGGGIMLNAAGVVNRDNLHNRSRLLELGWRRSFGARGRLGLTAFRQERKRVEIRGPRSDLDVHGLEAEFFYEVPGGSYGFANATWSRAEFRDSAPGQLGGRSLFDLYAPGTGPLSAGTGRGFDFFFMNQVGTGDYRVPGWSGFSGRIGWAWAPDWRWESQWRIWGDYQSRQSGNLDEEYWIPGQFTLNTGYSVGGERWRLSLQLLNLSNERNWLHNGQTFFNNQLVFRAPPRRLSAAMQWEF